MKVLDLFSGIGGFSLGLERAGFETVAFCEIEPFCQKVLAKHWPDIPIYTDVRELTYERLKADGINPNCITGGFPCQDISVAGKQKGIAGERSGLWSECARLLGEIRPDYAIFENVTALLSGENGKWFERVLWDISQVGYDAEWHCISASELGANHHRDRVWIIAYTTSEGANRYAGRKIPEHTLSGVSGQNVANPESKHSNERDYQPICEVSQFRNSGSKAGGFWEVEPELGRVADGIPDRVHRLKALGNSVVPQIPEIIGRAIKNPARQ